MRVTFITSSFTSSDELKLDPDLLTQPQCWPSLTDALLAEGEQIPAAGYKIIWKDWNQKSQRAVVFIPLATISILTVWLKKKVELKIISAVKKGNGCRKNCRGGKWRPAEIILIVHDVMLCGRRELRQVGGTLLLAALRKWGGHCSAVTEPQAMMFWRTLSLFNIMDCSYPTLLSSSSTNHFDSCWRIYRKGCT